MIDKNEYVTNQTYLNKIFKEIFTFQVSKRLIWLIFSLKNKKKSNIKKKYITISTNKKCIYFKPFYGWDLFYEMF